MSRRGAPWFAWGGLVLAAWSMACPRPSDTPQPPVDAEVREPSAQAQGPTQAPATLRDAPRVLTDPGSGVRVVWSGAAVQAAVAGGNVVVLEPDLRHLSAIDWRDGEARWRIEQPVSEGVVLHGLGDRVLLHERDQAIVVEAARGRVLGRNPAPWAGRWPDSHGVQRSRGACAWLGECGIQAFDCEDGRPLGAYLASPEIHFYGTSDDPSEHSTSCMRSPRLLGRHDDVVVLDAAPAPGPGSNPDEPALIGLDRSKGETRWSQALPPESITGLTEDGGVWVLDEQAPRLDVLDARDGSLRWQRAIGPGTLEVQAVGDVLVVAREHGGRWRLSAYATADGRPGWSTRLSRWQRPVLPQGPVPQAQVTGSRRVYALVDPSHRGVLGELVAGRDERLWLDPGGGFVLIGAELREIDAQGHLTRQRPFTGTRVHTVTAGHVLTQNGPVIEIYDREQLRERARIEGQMSIETEDALPDDRLLLMRHGGDDGVALLLELESPTRAGTRR